MIPLAEVERNLERLHALAWSRRFCERMGAGLDEVARVGRPGGKTPRVARARREFICTLGDTLGLGRAEAGRVLGIGHKSVLVAYAVRERERAAGLR